MAGAFSCFEPFDVGNPKDFFNSVEEFQKNGSVHKGQETHLYASQDWVNVEDISSQYGLYEENITQEGLQAYKDQQEQQQFSDITMLDSFQSDNISPSFQSHQQINLNTILNDLSEAIQPWKEKPQATNITPLELLKNSFLRRRNAMKLNETPNCERLSTEEVMRVACAQHIQASTQQEDSVFMHPFGCSLSGLTDEETKDVQLAQLLLASAEKIGNLQFDRGSKLLDKCHCLSSSIGSPVQRVVFYFAEALQERIFRKRGGTSSEGIPVDVGEHVFDMGNEEIIAYHQALPFSQVLQFTGVQAIIDNVSFARKVHLIDFGIIFGLPWTVLMHALAERHGCPIELLKITAVGMKNQQMIEETGKRLKSFAESLSLPFSFKVIMASDMKDVKLESFELQTDEAIVICAPSILRTMINNPVRLESLMKVIRNLNPCMMIVMEVEANHNSPSFFHRFTEALFFYGAVFDCFEACLDGKHQSRMKLERKFFDHGIMNMVATEGKERTCRHVGIEVWRAFFERFGWVETEFSDSSLLQANLLLKQLACGSSCTLDMNGKCITLGWKGTPLHSLSIWKLVKLGNSKTVV